MSLRKAVVLVDGEHYPPVLEAMIASLHSRYEIAAAVFLGGSEKLKGALSLGELPVVSGSSPREALQRALDAYAPDVVVDASDEPVLTTRGRFLLASVALSCGVPYEGAGFRFEPPRRPRLSERATVAVIGTGKRTGKTAVSGALARHAAARGLHVVMVAMGRGGPAEPVVTRSRLDADELLALADTGEHAASDTYEDAVFTSVTTVGARRAGAGFSGEPLYDTVARAIEMAEHEAPDLIILEGSGTAIPPARAGATVLVAGERTSLDVAAGFGWYRLLISDLCVVTMAEEPLPSETSTALTSSLAELGKDVPVIETVFRPAPAGSVAGLKTFFTTTAPRDVGPRLVEHLEREWGANIVGISHRLSDRPGLVEDLERAEGTYDVLLTELKAAAIDVAARAAVRAGRCVVFCDNEVRAHRADLAAAFDAVIARAQENR
ncbi:MAG: cyclic 2,3-diphosphoglycerate synthetase [Actinomycetota bacterium]